MVITIINELELIYYGFFGGIGLFFGITIIYFLIAIVLGLFGVKIYNKKQEF
jgi:hypothetical protein